MPVDVSPEDWYEKLAEIAGDAEVEQIGYGSLPGVREKHIACTSLLSGIRSQGGEPRFVYKTGTADLNIVAPGWKCPAVVYGPGDSSLDHTPNEHISLDDYSKSVQVLSSVLIS